MEMNLFNRKNELNIMLMMLIYKNIDERSPYFLLLTLLFKDFTHGMCVSVHFICYCTFNL